MDGDRWDEQVGTVAEEAQRLLESLRRAGGDPGPEPGPTSGTPGGRTPEEPGEAGGTEGATEDDGWVCTDPFCRACPLCRTVAVVRGLSPETLRRLSDLATVAASVLADLAGERSAHGPGADAGESPDRGRRPGTAAPTAQPIPVRPADGAGDD